MIYGMDTGYLVAAEVAEHPQHAAARARLATLMSQGDTIAIAPQVMAEFLHIVTDAKRFGQPLDMPAAIGLAEQWWQAREVSAVYPNDLATRQFLTWLRDHHLGRRRLLDTLLAATYWQANITAILTTNPADFGVFGCFQCVTP